MRRQSRSLGLILVLFVLVLGACTSEDLAELEDILDPDNADPSSEQLEQSAGEGSADVYYHYHMNVEFLKFKIDMPFGITFSESDRPGDNEQFDANGIFQDMVDFSMAGQHGGSYCWVHCTVNLKFVAQGRIELGENGECQIPMNFSFVPQGDYIMDTDCPPEAEAIFDCNALSMVLADPSTYVFSAADPDPKIPSENSVKLEAEIKNLVLPSGVRGLCTW